MNRRKFLKRVAKIAGVGVGLGLGGYAYGRFEAGWLRLDEQTIPVTGLPRSFDGLRIGLLTDPHLGTFTTDEQVHAAAEVIAGLRADLIVLGGDFTQSSRRRRFIRPCLQELGRLTAPLGVYAVPGNHDYWADITATRQAIRDFGVTDLTNAGTWIERGSERLRIAGVDDLLCGEPRLEPALGDIGPHDACLLLSHNPEFTEAVTDPRVKLVLSGHMHGGQVVIPGFGYHRLPARYGTKYLEGLIQGPVAPVFVSRGVGTVGLPVRINCRPEVNLLTLRAG